MTSLEALKQYFGYNSFRGGQESLINDLLSGSDVLGVMPTGAGKSICFQIPALLMRGITLVISPLISLMKDQVNALTQSGVPAAFINSSISNHEIYIILQNAANGAYKLLYVAPERLFAPSFVAFVKSADISMLAVDEAHCISQWGQDFRPSYSEIPKFIKSLSKRPVISAFTATATPKVREDIAISLELNNPTVLVTGFNRENLYFEVQKPRDKFKALTDFINDKKEQIGIVYCSTRKTVEEVYEGLKEAGYNAARYHAGLNELERHNNQDDFLFDRVRVMVATNAFGMGIDKSNVSFVIHYNMPLDIESYYQEAGRAGRDGEPAECVLFYSGQDVHTASWLIENTENKEHLDAETKSFVKECSRNRLREMTFYCATKDCLRGYILKYFGENPPNHCGNCINCITNFETLNITVDAQKIFSCVGRMRERFGIKMIIDVLRGSENEKIQRYGLHKLSTYGISEKSDNQLREIINYLILNRYLYKTDDEFPKIKLGERSVEVLRGGSFVEMKVLKEQTLVKPIVRNDIRPVNKKLLNILRDLRQNIADKQRVPAFTVFTDSALVDMCMKIPKTNKEFLNISGVGKVKQEKYGEYFLNVIADFIQNSEKTKIFSEASKTFDISEIEISDESVTVSVIADRINSITMQCGYGRISGKRINDWLSTENYLELINENGKNFKIPTVKGIKHGIISDEWVIRGENSKVNLFSRRIQELIINNTLNIIGN